MKMCPHSTSQHEFHFICWLLSSLQSNGWWKFLYIKGWIAKLWPYLDPPSFHHSPIQPKFYNINKTTIDVNQRETLQGLHDVVYSWISSKSGSFGVGIKWCITGVNRVHRHCNLGWLTQHCTTWFWSQVRHVPFDIRPVLTLFTLCHCHCAHCFIPLFILQNDWITCPLCTNNDEDMATQSWRWDDQRDLGNQEWRRFDDGTSGRRRMATERATEQILQEWQFGQQIWEQNWAWASYDGSLDKSASGAQPLARGPARASAIKVDNQP